MKIFFNILYYVVFLLIIAVAAVLFVPALPIEGNIQTKVVLSGSMEPTIKVGSVIIIRPTNSYDIGDVITYGDDSPSAIPTTHRILNSRIEDGRTLYQTKGDANPKPDSREVRESEIIGEMLFSIPFLGYLIDFAKKPLGFLIIIVVPAAFIILDELRKIIVEIVRMRKKKQKSIDIDE